MEIFKEISGYEGHYKIGSLGTVLSFKRGKIKAMKTHTQGTGYLKVILCINGKIKTCYIHRLVADAFLTKSNEKPEVNHIDGNKLNNTLKNLEWINSSDNVAHSHNVCGKKYSKHIKITPSQIIDIESLIFEGTSIKKVSELMNIPRSTIMHKINNGLISKGGLSWQK